MFKRIINWWYQKFPREMVQYWMHKEAVRAKVLQHKEGHYYMILEGEKYPFPGFPRGVILMSNNGGHSNFSVMKHTIKNFVFNKTWDLLQMGRDLKAIRRIKTECLDKLKELRDTNAYEMLPYENLQPPVKRIYDAFTKTSNDPRVLVLRDVMCFILEEDDGYRFRLLWVFKFFPRIKLMARGKYKELLLDALDKMVHAEVSDDMRGRIKLLRTVIALILTDKKILELFNKFFENLDWNKCRLTKADKYYFRAKYYRVDYPEYDY